MKVTEPDPQRVFIGLGSNLGDRLRNLERAVAGLNTSGAHVVRVSPVYETQYIGPQPGSQPDYLNCVAEVQTALAPCRFLRVLHSLEAAAGRPACPRSGPRPLDADLLLYGNATLELPDLIVPHPRMWERAFVLIPLSDLDDSIMTPEGQPIARRAQELLSQGQRVKLYTQWHFVTGRPVDELPSLNTSLGGSRDGPKNDPA